MYFILKFLGIKFSGSCWLPCSQVLRSLLNSKENEFAFTRMRLLRAAICLAVMHHIFTLPAATISSVRQHHQQQHVFASSSVFREMVEQVLLKPADVQLVFAHIPEMFPSGTYLQARSHVLR